MLYKFKSQAAGDVIMLEANGRSVLQAIGKDPGARGIILPEEIDGAVAALEAAIAKEEADHKARSDEATARGEKTAPSDAVSLRQRAVPFIDMLRRAGKEKAEIVWGV